MLMEIQKNGTVALSESGRSIEQIPSRKCSSFTITLRSSRDHYLYLPAHPSQYQLPLL